MTAPDDMPHEQAAASPTPADAVHEDRNAGTRPALLDLPAQWAKLTSGQKLRAKQVGVVSTIALLGLGLYTASHSGQKEAPKRRRRPISTWAPGCAATASR
jgi:conjugal transfer pilus assembly protein TraB